ncbi:MAG TPA: hypothetical protein VGE08_09760 [Steroidobacter sp.]|uniref:putative adhesin n=1 Tax=Steroidobacter sp. TaxID=1978227 RepID=UPI002ED787F8
MARKNVYIVGHGAWAPKDGYAKVPAGCTISFYTEFAKTLSGDDADRIVAGTLKRPAHRTVGEFKMVPNMRYTPDDDDNMEDFKAEQQPGTILIFTQSNAGQTLEQLFHVIALKGIRNWDMHWTACSALQLRATGYDDRRFVGNPMTGVNLTEMDKGYYNFDYDIGKYSLQFRK